MSCNLNIFGVPAKSDSNIPHNPRGPLGLCICDACTDLLDKYSQECAWYKELQEAHKKVCDCNK